MNSNVKFLVENGIWRLQQDEGQGMDILGMFLASDVSWNEAPYFRAWLLDTAIKSIEGNFSLMFKKRDQLLITSLYAENMFDHSLQTSIQAIVDLLQQWEAMCKQNEEKLEGAYITYDGTKFYLSPLFISSQE